MAHKKYRIEISDIDGAIAAFVAGGDVAGPRTTYLCRHSTKAHLLAPLKAVMWPKGHRHPSYARLGGADGGEARRAARALGYVEEALSQHTLNDDGALQNAITRLAIRKPPHELRIMRFVDGGRLANVVKKYVDAEAALREMLGRPAERVDALRAMGEYLYCRLFAGIQAPPNQYGYDVVVGPVSRPTTVQVKVARKAEIDPSWWTPFDAKQGCP